MEICKRIQLLRIKYNMTQRELGKLIGVSVVSIGAWESGSRKPSAEAIIALAKAFKVSTDYLLGVINNPEKDQSLLNQHESNLLSNYRLLDQYGRKAVDTICAIEKSRIRAGAAEANKNINFDSSICSNSARYIPLYTTPSAAGLSVPLDGDDFEMIRVDESTPIDADFAVGIQGNSMYPYIHDGDTVYVKKSTELSIGDIGIFCVDGAMYCKQYYLDTNGNLILLSANPLLKHTNIYIQADSDTDVRCYGKVLLDKYVKLPDYIYE